MAIPKLKIILSDGTNSRDLLWMVHRGDEGYSGAAPSSLSLASSCLPFTSSSRDPISGPISGSSRNLGAKSDVVVRNPLETPRSAATTP